MEKPPSDLETVRSRLNVVTQETRFALLQDILGHPEGLATLKELDYVNPKIYDRVEKTDEIERYEAAPRPER